LWRSERAKVWRRGGGVIWRGEEEKMKKTRKMRREGDRTG